MAEGKKSFLLYADIISTVEKLPDDLAGKLFKLILQYVNDKNPNNPTDLLLEIAFEPIKQQLKRDLKKWDAFKIKQSENGKLGGRPRKKKPKNPGLNFQSQKSLSVNVSVNDIILYLNQKCSTKYLSDTNSNKKHIVARLNENFTLEDFKKVIDKKFVDWGTDEKMRKYLRPETLFGSKFESYLNEIPSANPAKKVYAYDQRPSN